MILDAPVARYTDITKVFPLFKLKIYSGQVRRGEIVGIDGTNALGKTTYMGILVGVDKPDSGNIEIGARISFKSQYLKQDYDGDVHSLLYVAYHLNAIEGSKIEEQILIPMGIKKLYERNVKNLS